MTHTAAYLTLIIAVRCCLRWI